MTPLVETRNEDEETRDLLNGSTTEMNGEEDHEHEECHELNGANGEATTTSNHRDAETQASSQQQMTGRTGTISSARFNLLSTMVGGGSLSLPLAFQKTGNILLAPLLLIVIAALTEFCFRILSSSTRLLSPIRDNNIPGKDSYESIAQAAFGRKAHIFSMVLVVFMCFFGTVAYCVLLRDLASTFLPQHLTKVFGGDNPRPGPNFPNNVAMLSVILLVTPFCTLRTLTALQRFGAASMLSVAILAFCITFRSVQCNLTDKFAHVRKSSWWDYVSYGPQSPKDVLDALPLFVSCFVCHYTVPLVQNELVNPTPARVAWWIQSTTWSAAIFYLLMGITGSSFGNCTPDGTVHGNILLDFSEDDPLLLVGRICLAITVTLAFPMLVIPARDILIRAFARHAHEVLEETVLPVTNTSITSENHVASIMEDGHSEEDEALIRSLQQPLLEQIVTPEVHREPGAATTASLPSLRQRLVAALILFWAAAALACVVPSIDVVWDLLGSSLSILMSYLIPCSSYILIKQKHVVDDIDNRGTNLRNKLSKLLAWILIFVFTPLMVLSTANAIYNTVRPSS
jgi:amino acid permease